MAEFLRQHLTIGSGIIGPEAALAQGKYDQSAVDRFVDSLLDDNWYLPRTIASPVLCADGRTTKQDGLSAIGGSFTAVMMDALGPRRWYRPGMPADEHAKTIYDQLIRHSQPLGGHDDDHASGDNCGCGGEDKLGLIIDYLNSNLTAINDYLTELKFTLSGERIGLSLDPNMQQIADNAASLNDYVVSGNKLRQAMAEKSGESAIEKLHGEHAEVAVVIDSRSDGFVLKRADLFARSNNLMQAFYVNAAGLEFVAKTLYQDPAVISLGIQAALAYNVAATAVLSGPSLAVVVR